MIANFMLYVFQVLLWPLMLASFILAVLLSTIYRAVSSVYVFSMTDEQLRRHRDKNKDTDND